MNARERVQAVLNKRVPDSVPRSLYDSAIDSFNETTIELFERKMHKHPRDCFRQDLRGMKVNVAGLTKERRLQVKHATGAKDVEEAFRGVLPEDVGPGPTRERVRALHADGYPVIYVGQVSDFESPFSYRGREQFFMDLGYQEDWLPLFLDRITDMAVFEARLAAQAGADIFGIGDDLGSQRGLLISPDMWRELFKPRLKRIIDAAKNTRSDIAFFLHSDGDIQEIIPELIEIGVDILNPIQPEVMDPAEVKRAYGNDLIFFGAISVQHTLPLGTPDDVFNEVKLRMETIGAGGGYLMTPSHLVNADIPWENIVAFFEAADKYGTY